MEGRGPLAALEQRVVDEIARREDELVALLGDLIGFDTTARGLHDPPREEAELQTYLADRLGRRGARCDLWEPTPDEIELPGMIPPGLDFRGRPQLAARFPGSGEGRSLIFNGHVDVVAATHADGWRSDPRRAEVRDGLLYGRGACDMKGGVAAMTFAAEVLAELVGPLAGDLIVSTVTDEESYGGGGVASVRHGVTADAAVVTEPTGGDVWVACRGSLVLRVTVEGRRGHAGLRPRHWLEGGPVNAIAKMDVVREALARLHDEWRDRPDQRHPHLSPGDLVLTELSGGEWAVTVPGSCTATYHVTYLPAGADEQGWGSRVRREVEERVARAAACDPWLAQHPPRLDWRVDVMPSEVGDDEPVVAYALAAGAAVGFPGRVTGMDSWHDGASFTRLGGTPAVCFGPGDLDVAHQVDEHVPVVDLVRCAQALAVTAMRFCGVPARLLASDALPA